MNNIFDQKIDRKNTNCTKYDGLAATFGKDDIMPFWIADMDFPVPNSVTEALIQRTNHPIYGYNLIPHSYYGAFIAWQNKHHNWEVKEEWLAHTSGVLTGLAAAILTFTKESDGILIQSPVYFPFSSTIEALGRKVVNNQLKYEDGNFRIDFEDLERKARQAKLFIFCSPHNPSGRVWSIEELKKVEEICKKHDLFVFSDEIHSDIVYKPNKHVIFATISEWSKENSIVAMAPSKTFNIPGLHMSIMIIPNEDLRREYTYYLRYGLHCANPNSFGIVAAEACYQNGERWYKHLLEYLENNINYLDNTLKKEIPEIKFVKPQATYIPLIDMKALNMTDEELQSFMVYKVGAALNLGKTFGDGGEGFMRINIATQQEDLVKFIDMLKVAIREG